MSQFRTNKPTTVVDLIEEMQRRSSVQPVAPPVTPPAPAPVPGPTVGELRDRYVILLTAREYAPDRLSDRALFFFDAHQKVAMEYCADDAEEVYADTASGYLMRQRLKELIPDWWEV